MSRVLVTGATGFVGRHALPLLAAHGHEVHALSSRAAPAGGDGVTWHRADLLSSDGVAAAIAAARPELLLHLAWFVEHGAFWSSPENTRWVEASMRLLGEFAGAGGRGAVLAGTCAEYDWSHGRCVEGVTPLEPATLYGRSKHSLHLAAEALAREAGVSLGWGRIFFLYGPWEDPRRLVPSVIRSLLAGEPALTSDGTQVRDFLHVEDVAAAFVALLESGVDGPVNIGSGEGVTIAEVVTRAARLAGRPELLRLGALPPREGDPRLLLAETRRLREEVGFSPAIGLDEGLERTIAWWRERGG